MEQVKSNGRTFWSTGGDVISFIEEHCRLTNGRWTGHPFRLLPWQKRLLYELFEVDPNTGLRRYRRALIGTPRKQGKTEFAAALALYLAIGDGEPSAEVYCAAASEEQADRVFQAASRMVELSPTLAQAVDGEASRLTVREDPYSYIQRLTSSGKTKHGLNIHGVILDELHAWGAGQQEELWAALSTGSAARLQPLQIAITTAGTDQDESRCGELYQLGKRIESGEVEDDGGFFFRWWEAPDDADYRDPAVWRAASPSFGEIVDEDFYRSELSTIREPLFRRLYLNQWVDITSEPWLKPGQWEACAVPGFALQTGAPTWVGVDLSETRDSTAVVAGQLWSGRDRPCGHQGEACLYVKLRAWERPLRADRTPDPRWQVPQAEVKAYIRQLASEYTVVTVVFDPWHSKLMRQDLENEGLPVEEMWQTGARRSGATASLYDRVIQGRIHHDGDPVLARHVANATTRASGSDGGYYLAKRRGGRPMDAAMATVNVVYGTVHAPEGDRPSIYETRGLLIL